MPGAAGATLTITGTIASGPRTPPEATTIRTVVPVTSNGIWKLICDGETKNNGAGVSLTRTSVPASMVGSGSQVAATVAAARFIPNSEAMEPGLTTASGEKLAPLTIPPSPITGGASASVRRGGILRSRARREGRPAITPRPAGGRGLGVGEEQNNWGDAQRRGGAAKYDQAVVHRQVPVHQLEEQHTV